MNRAERNERAAWLRYAVVKMTIRYGSSMNKYAYALGTGKYDEAERYERAERRQFAAIKRLADAFETLARGESHG